MGLFGPTKKEKELAAQKQLLAALLASESKNKKNTKSPTARKTKYVTKQCKYCGYRVTYLANGIPVTGANCPRRSKGQPHVWQTLGYQYK